MSELAYKRTNVYETADERKLKEIFDYAEGYRAFIDAAKTEREACDYVAEEAEKRGYKPFKFGAKLKAGETTAEKISISSRWVRRTSQGKEYASSPPISTARG